MGGLAAAANIRSLMSIELDGLPKRKIEQTKMVNLPVLTHFLEHRFQIPVYRA